MLSDDEILETFRRMEDPNAPRALALPPEDAEVAAWWLAGCLTFTVYKVTGEVIAKSRAFAIVSGELKRRAQLAAEVRP